MAHEKERELLEKFSNYLNKDTRHSGTEYWIDSFLSTLPEEKEERQSEGETKTPLGILMKHNPMLLSSKYSIDYGITPLTDAMWEFAKINNDNKRNELLSSFLVWYKSTLNKFDECGIKYIVSEYVKTLISQPEAPVKEKEVGTPFDEPGCFNPETTGVLSKKETKTE